MTGKAPLAPHSTEDPSPPQRRVEWLIPGDGANLSPNRRMHWAERSRLKTVWKLLAQAAWMQADEPVFTKTVRISFVIYRGRKMDEDNLCASESLVALVNGLKGRAFPDDSPAYVVRGTVEQVTGKQYRGKEAVLMVLEEEEV